MDQHEAPRTRGPSSRQRRIEQLERYHETLSSDDRNDESLLGNLLAIGIAIASGTVALGSLELRDLDIEGWILVFIPSIPAVVLAWAATIKVRQQVREVELREVEADLIALAEPQGDATGHEVMTPRRLLGPIGGRWHDPGAVPWILRASLYFLAYIGPVINSLSFVAIVVLTITALGHPVAQISVGVVYGVYLAAIGVVVRHGIFGSMHGRLVRDRQAWLDGLHGRARP